MGLLVLGAVLVGLGVFAFFSFLAWKLWQESGQREGGRNFSDYVILGIFLPIPFVILFPAFPGFWIALSQCKFRGGEQVYQYVRTESYAIRWGRMDSHQYDFERLAIDLIERKIAYVEIMTTAQNSLTLDLRDFRDGLTYSRPGVARSRKPKTTPVAAPSMRFFISEVGAANCIDGRYSADVSARHKRIQEKLGLPQSLCVASEVIEESNSPYSVAYVEEAELFPAPIVWKALRLTRVSDGRTMAEDRSFWYRPYGSGLISAFVGTLAGSSLYAEGLRCEMKSAREGLFMQALHGARDQYQLDSRIRSSPALVKFYAL